MRHLKLFEELKEEPQIGDYIYIDVKDDFGLPKEQIEDSKNRIFRILYKRVNSNSTLSYTVYTILAVPEIGRKDYDKWYLFEEHILCFAPTIEELKLKNQTQKYNL